MPDPSSDAWTHIRYAYEHTDRPIVDICAEHGISPNTLRDRVRRWRWARRRAPIPRAGPPAMAVRLAAGDDHPPLEGEGRRFERQREPAGWGDLSAHETHPTPPDADPAAIVPRLQSAVARVLPAIEATIARLAAEPLRPREMEQTARALGALTRTLRELNGLLAQQPLRAAEPYDDMPEDMDAFRDELARRIRAFLASRADEDFAGEAGAAGPAKPSA
jgi:hypothetical protein